MKHLYSFLLTVALLCIGQVAQSQTITSKYVTEGGREVPADQAYYRVIVEKDSLGGGTSTRYYIKDNTKARLITYSSLDGGEHGQGVLHGLYHDWHPNGQSRIECTYQNDELTGAYTTWYENGQVRSIRQYYKGQLIDTLKTFYQSGALRRLEVYRHGNMVVGKLYGEGGNELLHSPMEVMPEFPGGEKALMVWLASNVRYPKATRKAKAQGVVVLSFVVDKEGRIDQAEVIRGFHPAADQEALRVMTLMPIWRPGLLEGQPEMVRYTLPIRFAIQ